ncbi:MAG: alpha/beta hydrolase [Marinoscillum sp.]
MKETHINYQHSAPYYRLNEYTPSTKRVWVVFHGYGQLAQFFIRKFSGLDPDENLIVAPQGTSKFYLEGFSGRVGANWMTKEDRLNDIANQYAYIDQVLQHEQIEFDQVELIYFGFSQGVATMCRYAAHARLAFSKMIIWAGTIPPELDSIDFDFNSGQESILYFTGTKDPFYKEGMEEAQKTRIKEVMDIAPEVIWFEGEHEVVSDLVQKI